MIIETRELGFVEIGEDSILTFPNAIYGFSHANRYVLLSDNSNADNPFMWLQCVDDKNVCFIVTEPSNFFDDYSPRIPDEACGQLKLDTDEDLRLFVIVTVPKTVQDMYANLRCPIALNAANKTAMQVILEDERFPMRKYLLERAEG